MLEEPQQSGLTEERLARLSGAKFENLVNDYLRAKLRLPEIAGVGSAPKEAPVGFPVDALGYIHGDEPTWIFAAATTTTEDGKIAEKWFGHGNKENDVKKAAGLFAQAKEQRPSARCRLYIALSHRPGKRQDLWPKVIREGETFGIEVHPLEASAIASYLDTDPHGQYLRERYLDVAGELLSMPLLRDLSGESVSLLRATAALAVPEYEVRREATDAILAVLDEPGGAVIHIQGSPGMGKTVVLAQVGEAVLERGGAALWIPAGSLRPHVSLEGLLLDVLCDIRPGLHHSAGRSAIELASSSEGGLILLFDDINRHEDPERCLAVIDRLARQHQPEGVSPPAPLIGVHCVVSVWPDVQETERGERVRGVDRKHLIPVNTYSMEEERKLANSVQEHGRQSTRPVFGQLGGDPFLCGLALLTDRTTRAEDTRALLHDVMSGFLNRVVSTVAGSSSIASTPSQVLEALDALVDLILESGIPEPNWSTVWTEVGERQASLLLSVADSRILASLTGAEEDERWHWKHRRLRDIAIARRLARRVTKAASEDRVHEEIKQRASNPGLGDALALSLVFLPASFTSENTRAILDNLGAPSLAEVLRLGIFTDEGEERSRVIARLRSLLEDIRPDGVRDYIESEYWRTLGKLSATRDPQVPGVVEGARGWAELAARMRNGDVLAAIGWIETITRQDDLVLMGMPEFQAALEDFLATTDNVEEMLRVELAQPHGVENIKVRMLLVAAGGRPALAKDVWNTWESLSAEDRLDLLPTLVWALSRCVDRHSSIFLERALRRWAETLGNPPETPSEVHDIWLTLNHWPFSEAAIVTWVDVGLEGSLPTRCLRHIIRRLDHPYAVESYLRWCVAHPDKCNLWLSEPRDRLAPLPDAPDHFPKSDESRTRLWELVQGEHDQNLRRLAFEVWRRKVTMRDVGRLQTLNDEDDLFAKALETRLRLRDASAAPALLPRLRRDPGDWMGFAPAVYWEEGVHKAIVDNLGTALACWKWAVEEIFVHLPAEGVGCVVEECKEVLLGSPRTWSALWRAGEPTALALVYGTLCASNAVSDEDELALESNADDGRQALKFFFSPFTFDQAYGINRTMIETIEPFLDRFPSTQLGYLAEAAVAAGLDDWARRHLKGKVPDYVARKLWLQTIGAREILDRAASVATRGTLAILNSPGFIRLRSRDGLDFDLFRLLQEWLFEAPTADHFAVSAIVVDAVGTGSDVEQWEPFRPVDMGLLAIWEDVLYTLQFRGWEGM